MNLEFLAQVFDAFAFLFVTPEIIGDDLLQRLREFLSRSNYVVGLLYCVFLVIYAVVVLSNFPKLIGLVIKIAGNKNVLLDISIVCAIVLFIYVTTLFLSRRAQNHIIPWLTRMIESLAFRRNLFLMGVGFFIAARVIGSWLAYHPQNGCN